MEAWKGNNPVMPLGRGGCTIRSPMGEGGKVRNAVARDRVCPFARNFGKTLGGNFRRENRTVPLKTVGTYGNGTVGTVGTVF